MCEQEEPKIMPGAALHHTLACGQPASVARAPLAALDAFEKLKGFLRHAREVRRDMGRLAPTAAAAAARAAVARRHRAVAAAGSPPTPPPHRAALGATG